eukprot:g4018.t1
MLDPGCARSALQYRLDRLPGARAKAALCGKQAADGEAAWCPPGYSPPPEAAAFPWESAYTGSETQMSRGKLGPWGEYEQHITGDIALAARQYWYATGDEQWLREVGFPLANASASFYAARLTPAANNGTGYDILQVMGPDEFAWPVDNSAYTNAVAAIALSFAAEAAAVLGLSVPAEFAAKAAAINIEIDDAVPTRPDLKGGYHPEYRGFPKNPARPTVKQADTIMLEYPLGVAMSPTVLANDLSFYDGITSQTGPAMTWSMFAIGWFNVGNYTASQRHFLHGYANVQAPFRVWTETPGGGTVNFITGAGGFLQSVLFGTSGMRIGKAELTFKPPPPRATGTNATAFTVHSLHFRGSRLRQQVAEVTATYELLGADADAVPLCIACEGAGAAQPLVAGKPLSFARGSVCTVKGQ